jgi:hypothetical protein
MPGVETGRGRQPLQRGQPFGSWRFAVAASWTGSNREGEVTDAVRASERVDDGRFAYAKGSRSRTGRFGDRSDGHCSKGGFGRPERVTDREPLVTGVRPPSLKGKVFGPDWKG